jgi:hypothetical protein
VSKKHPQNKVQKLRKAAQNVKKVRRNLHNSLKLKGKGLHRNDQLQKAAQTLHRKCAENFQGILMSLNILNFLHVISAQTLHRKCAEHTKRQLLLVLGYRGVYYIYPLTPL